METMTSPIQIIQAFILIAFSGVILNNISSGSLMSGSVTNIVSSIFYIFTMAEIGLLLITVITISKYIYE
jgi:hypothetical protein